MLSYYYVLLPDDQNIINQFQTIAGFVIYNMHYLLFLAKLYAIHKISNDKVQH